MNKYDDEATQYQNTDSEATQFEDNASGQSVNETTGGNEEVKVHSAKGGMWKHMAVGAGSGLLIGSVATLLMGMKAEDVETDSDDSGANHREELSHPEWVDDQIQVATSVNDDMSFGEAFDAARAEVGAGGCFEWRGNLYGTYLADEWDNMTAEQRAEYGSHFSWSNIDHSESDVAQHTTGHDDAASHPASAGDQTVADDDIEVVESTIPEPTPDVVDTTLPEPSVEVLGVVHDPETDANIGGMVVDGQEIILVDVDNDMRFDYMASDLNGNGVLDQGELVDIQDQNLTVNDLGGINNPDGGMIATTDNSGYPDYTVDNTGHEV